MESLNQRVVDVEFYLKDLVETSLNQYGKGEWLGIVRSKQPRASNDEQMSG